MSKRIQTSKRTTTTRSRRASESPMRRSVRLDEVFTALSDPVRIGIVVKLYRDGECSCAELDGGRPKSTMSHHFKVLRSAGLVQTRNEGVTHMNRLCRREINAAFPGLLKAVVAAAKKSE